MARVNGNAGHPPDASAAPVTTVGTADTRLAAGTAHPPHRARTASDGLEARDVTTRRTIFIARAAIDGRDRLR
ncbi:hypothetical protein P3T23_009479 [Paraburkholderia sp. GAS448]